MRQCGTEHTRGPAKSCDLLGLQIVLAGRAPAHTFEPHSNSRSNWGPDLQSQLQEVLGSSYLIDRELGGGGMSRVFVATDTELDRQVVVKNLPPDLAARFNADRFRREIQLAARLTENAGSA